MMQEDQQVKQGREESLWGDILNFSLRLLLVCALAAAGLGITYSAAKDNIAKMEKQEKEDGAIAVLEPLGLSPVDDPELLAEVKAASDDLNSGMYAVFRGEDASGRTGGYAFVLKAKGYNFMTMAVGIDKKGKIIAVDVVTQEETPGIGSVPAESEEYLAQYEGLGPDPLRLNVDVDAKTGATFTSKGIMNGVNLALEAFNVINEGK
jgi:RnfABCDGE-type electron transport complex G subunit